VDGREGRAGDRERGGVSELVIGWSPPIFLSLLNCTKPSFAIFRINASFTIKLLARYMIYLFTSFVGYIPFYHTIRFFIVATYWASLGFVKIIFHWFILTSFFIVGERTRVGFIGLGNWSFHFFKSPKL
jgi:hypothetical protein